MNSSPQDNFARFRIGSWLVFCAIIAATGCKSSDPAPGKAGKLAPQSRGAYAKAFTNSPAGKQKNLKPARQVFGKVIEVRPQLRFVIVDFSGSPLPALEQKLSVYRLDQKVAEIQVSGPYRNMIVAADIIRGEAKYGDLVKQE